MRKPIVSLALLCAFVSVSAQEIVLTLHAKYNNEPIPIDSLVIKNISTMVHYTFVGLPVVGTFNLNLKTGSLYTENRKLSYRNNSPIEIIQKRNGSVLFQSKPSLTGNIELTVYSVKGEKLYSETFNAIRHLPIALEIGMPGIFLVNVESDGYFETYKVSGKQGAETIHLKYSGTQSNLLKSQYTETLDKVMASIGDKLEINAYTAGYYSYPILVTVQKNETFDFQVGESNLMMTDPRDGKRYKTIKIGKQTWLAENLGYLPELHQANNKSYTSPRYYVYGAGNLPLADTRNTFNYATYGTLYNWPAATQSCPQGWKLPNASDWSVLYNQLGGEKSASGKLKEIGNYHWLGDNSGASNISYFTALPGGYRETDNNFKLLGSYALFWNASQYNADSAFAEYIGAQTSEIERGIDKKEIGFSVRCIKVDDISNLVPKVSTLKEENVVATSTLLKAQIIDGGASQVLGSGFCWNTTGNPTVDDNNLVVGFSANLFEKILFGLSVSQTYYVRAYAINLDGIGYGNEITFTTAAPLVVAEGTFTDPRDNKVYKTAQLGSQTWMAENLAYLPMVSPPSNRSQTQPAMYVAHYNGNVVNEAKASEYYTRYGALYNWPAALTACPTGWHLPNDSEWDQLTTFLGGMAIAGGRLKETGNQHWEVSTTGTIATNEAKFNARAGGYMYIDGYFKNQKLNGFWWSAAEESTWHAHGYFIYYNNADITFEKNYSKDHAFSVRCLKD